MAGWDWEANWNRDVLERIVVLLFALAGLADRAAGVPFLRRRQVLEILFRAEAEARAFVIAMAHGTPIPDTMPEPNPTAPEPVVDAAGLAANLRALALALWFMLARTRRLTLPGAIVARCGRREPAAWSMRGRRVALPAPDTS